MDISDFKNQVEYFLEATYEARLLSQNDRDFYSGYQYTAFERQVLNARKQIPVTINRIKPKIEGLKGLLEIRRGDIKAFPRNPKDEDSAHAITDALRYIEDNNDFEMTDAEVFEEMCVEGYGAVIVDVIEDARKEKQIKIMRIPWDRFYFDPHSIRHDFADAQYMGQMLWLDEQQVKIIFGNKVNLSELSAQYDSDVGDCEIFEDKPRYWTMADKNRNRYRIAQHFYVDKGVWKVCFFSGDTFLEKPIDSPYLDEDGLPTCPIIAQSAYIDRDNLRYGEVRAFVDLQKEINFRRSKALHFFSARQTIGRRGAVKDVNALKRELAKPDGHIEVDGEVKDFELLNTNDMTQGQLNLYLDAKQELDAQSVNAQLSGERSSGNLSGKAIDRLQSAGSLEVATLFKRHKNFKKRVFRQAYASVKQYWTEEKWVRVTDDQDNLKWTGLNYQVTVEEFLSDIVNDESKPLAERKGAAYELTRLTQEQSPALQEIITIKNNVAELDFDIILEESQDVVNIQQEQFALLAQFAQSRPEISIEDLLEFSSLKNKNELIEKIATRKKQQLEAAGGQAQRQAQADEVKNAKMFADAQLTEKKAEQTAIKNAMLMLKPDPTPQIYT